MKCDVLELLILKAALGSCPSKFAPLDLAIVNDGRKMLVIKYLLNPLLIKAFIALDHIQSAWNAHYLKNDV
ncbi:hypothetical protein SLEP1_g3798 [Rubroshorea leprosula]|uniref:Uncharacterized protein n=1 Tax=Rubroshorea leprosula TaxID=152421 RepID=A0AAV5HLM1_9ROSI|nr:hypothetical protein SLEP1_g3798 [Rubroshorea leprosula]